MSKYIFVTIAWLISYGMGFILGFYIRTLANRIKNIQLIAQTLIQKKKDNTEVESPSAFIDMDDPLYRAKYEHEQMMKKLNPGNEE